MIKKIGYIAVVFVFSSLLLTACFPESPQQIESQKTVVALSTQIAALQAELAPPDDKPITLPEADIVYNLVTASEGELLVYIGVGGDIDGVTNPTLTADVGQVVQIIVTNGQPVEHDLTFDEFGVTTGSIKTHGSQGAVTFLVEENGTYYYYCSLPGHRAAGMEGVLQVGEIAEDPYSAPSIVRNPADLPGPIGDRAPTLVQVELTAQEVVGQLADGTTYTYFTFNGAIPGPFIRAKVGDTVELTLNNDTNDVFIHSIDLHAVNGPGGGAVYTQVEPGQTKVFTFQALVPGIYVYHCATASVPHHIASGMFGMILIEPEGGLPPVDKEFYVMQSEVYTDLDFGTRGDAVFDHDAMLDEQPEYFVFNGASLALAADENALYANVGDTVRIFFGVAGPNFTSSFHVIGEIFDRVAPFGSLTSDAITDVQTVSVAPGGATMVEFKLDVPGRYILVDHALSRLERGLAGFLYAEGVDVPEIFHEGSATP